MRLLAQHEVQQRTVNRNSSVVLDEPQLAEFVHEKTDAGSGRADHFRKRLLTDLRNQRLGPSFLAEIREQQQQAREPFLARVEQLIDQVRLDANGPAQKIGNEHLGERRLAV